MKSDGIRSPRWKHIFQGNVFPFGLFRFLTDLSKEMIYPLLPAFFSGVVAPAAVAVYIVLTEGLADSTGSLLKFCRIAHLCGRSRRFVVGLLLLRLVGRIEELEGRDPPEPGGEIPGHLGDRFW